MRSAWAGGLHLRSRTDERRGVGEGHHTIRQSAVIQTDTNASVMLLPGFCIRKQGVFLQAFLVSLGVVALAEFGDKTQLLALVLAARFRRPVPIIAGIATATLINHFVAGAAGALIAAYLGATALRWLLAAAFLAAAVWALIPDRAGQLSQGSGRFGAFGTTVVSFFLMEIGDKTQFATVALAARYQVLLPVVAGTTLGMLLVDAPMVLLGEAAARRLPLRWIRRVAAALFIVLGVVTLLSHGTVNQPMGAGSP
jgi:Ca2+/H+ antiporter, TMEM165/GDT1 family